MICLQQSNLVAFFFLQNFELGIPRLVICLQKEWICLQKDWTYPGNYFKVLGMRSIYNQL